jgi:hypothetical protein
MYYNFGFRVRAASNVEYLPIFAETLDISQHTTRLTPESRSKTFNSSRKNLRTSKIIVFTF